MRIAINMAGFGVNNDWNEMVKAIFLKIANSQPVHQFIFIADGQQKDMPVTANIINTVLPVLAKNNLALKLWYDYKLPSFLKKQQVDLLVSTTGVCSLRCKIPQLLLAHDIGFSKNGFAKKRLPQSLAKAAKIVAFDAATQANLLEKGFDATKIKLANFFARPNFQPMDWQLKETVKEKYTGGKEYFLCAITKETADPLTLLKAFSLFKKRQQSNMQLLLISENKKTFQFLADKLSNYKYRSEVKLLSGVSTDEMISLKSAAYCWIYHFDGFIDLAITEAMQSGVPMIVLQTAAPAELTMDTILYAAATNPEAVAEQMKVVYKDENLRGRMIAAGIALAANNTVENAAASVWEALSAVTTIPKT